MSQGKFVVIRDSMLQQKVHPTTRIKEYYLATWKEYVATRSLVLAIQDNTTLSRLRKSLSRQQIHAIGRNSFAIKDNHVAI